MKLSFGDFVKDQKTTIPSISVDLSGKTVIVTGANVGLGLESAKQFARMNPGKLIVTCRDEAKGAETVAHICKETGCENVEAYVLDLGDFSSVKAFIKRFEEEGGDRLDILLENAGVSLMDLSFTKDGWETSAQINDLSTSLIALSLVPRMLETAEKYNTIPRAAVVSSEMHYWANIDKRTLEAPNFLRMWAHKDNLKKFKGSRYPETKLLNILFVRALNARLGRKPLIVTAPNPGFCISSIRRSLKFPMNLMTKLLEMTLVRGTEEGARVFVLASVGLEEKKDELRGAYFSTGEVREPADSVLGKAGKKLEDKIWDNLIDELTIIEPKIQQIVNKYLTGPAKDCQGLHHFP